MGKLLVLYTYYRAHGSPLVPFAEDAANFLGSKPVMEGRGAMVMELSQSAIVAGRHVSIGDVEDVCSLYKPRKQLE